MQCGCFIARYFPYLQVPRDLLPANLASSSPNQAMMQPGSGEIPPGTRYLLVLQYDLADSLYSVRTARSNSTASLVAKKSECKIVEDIRFVKLLNNLTMFIPRYSKCVYEHSSGKTGTEVMSQTRMILAEIQDFVLNGLEFHENALFGPVHRSVSLENLSKAIEELDLSFQKCESTSSWSGKKRVKQVGAQVEKVKDVFRDVLRNNSSILMQPYGAPQHPSVFNQPPPSSRPSPQKTVTTDAPLQTIPENQPAANNKTAKPSKVPPMEAPTLPPAKPLTPEERSAEEKRIIVTLLAAEVSFYGSEDVPRDLRRAVMLYSSIASCVPRAAFQLGVCHWYGFGTPKNEQLAKEAFRVGVEMGCTVCCLHLALLCLQWDWKNQTIPSLLTTSSSSPTSVVRTSAGLGHEAIEVAEMLRRACEDQQLTSRHPYVFTAMGIVTEVGSPECSIPPNPNLALEFYHHGAQLGCVTSGYHYARVHCEQNHPLSSKMMSRVAEQGHPHALNALGEMYEHGLGVVKDLRLAEQCYRKAKGKGSVRAEANLGYVLLVSKRFFEALECLYSAAEHGDPLAMMHLGALHYLGIGGVSADVLQAVSFFEKASDAGVHEATVMLGHVYYSGLGGYPRDLKRAQQYYSTALVHGVPAALEHFEALGIEQGGGCEPSAPVLLLLPEGSTNNTNNTNAVALHMDDIRRRCFQNMRTQRWGQDALSMMA